MPRILIVGGGVAGVATAWFLSQRGARDVVLVEREALCGTQSSGRNAAILRTLSSDAVTTAFARRSVRFLTDPPEGFTDVALVDRCGLVLAADEAGAAELLAWFGRSGAKAGGERIDPARVPELVPGVRAGAAAALAFPGEGRLDIAALMSGFERGATRRGVAIETGAGVRALAVEGGAVRGIHLDSGEHLEADVTVLAAGGWAGVLGAGAGSRVDLTPRRRHLLVTAPVPSIDPRGAVFWHHGREPFYARPESGGMLACACDEAVVDPDRCEVDTDVREEALRRLAEHVPGLADAGALRLWAGMRTFTPDGRFAIGPDPDLSGLFWVAGLGGHGMVASAAVGELAADRLLGRAVPAALDAARRTFDPERCIAAGA